MLKLHYRLTLAAICSIPLLAHGQIYKCQEGGKTTFSDKPCGASAQTVTLSKITTMDGIDQSKLDSMKATSKRGLLESEIKRIEDKITSYSKSMEQELSRLRIKKLRANNNLAGATWQESISTEMQSVTEKYKLKIDLKRDEIKRLNSEIGYLNSNQ
ncbi:DUF4124 domain-containing protein [Parendozoicomonas sp. Alg238-R29]|uniref:DUF4124 domain-containing protein n=1 Tax=Parendozoicomonas sp. Alg238-R29 TaxID=2993446 RepID=UPI00248D9DC3|nr:DUF4124 domain-containing protein [Parendozoicomonas sp. Alg238-R29]